MSMRHTQPGLVSLFIALLITAGCASTPKQAVVLAPAFHELDVRRITLLPIVDRRADRSRAFNEIKLRNAAAERLEKRGYSVSHRYRFFGDDGFVSAEDVESMAPSELTKLVPDGTDAALVLYVDDFFRSAKVVWTTAKVEMTGSLVSSQHGGEVWRGKGVGTSGQAGLIWAFLEETILESAISLAIYDLLASLPEAPITKAEGP